MYFNKKINLNYIILPSGIDKCVFLGYLVFFLGKWIDFENYFIFEYIFEKVIMWIYFFFIWVVFNFISPS